MKEYISELTSIYDNIEEYFTKYYFHDNYVDNKKKQIERTCVKIYEYLKNRIDDGDDVQLQLNDLSKVSKKLFEMVNGWVNNYNSLKLINNPRINEDRIIQDLFCNIITYYDGSFFYRFEDYGYDNAIEFSQMIVKFDEIISLEVIKHHNAEVAWKTLSKYLKAEYQSTFMNAYALNYEVIQRALIMEMLRDALLKEK